MKKRPELLIKRKKEKNKERNEERRKKEREREKNVLSEADF